MCRDYFKRLGCTLTHCKWGLNALQCFIDMGFVESVAEMSLN